MLSVAEAYKSLPEGLPHCVDSWAAWKVLLDVTGPVCDNMSAKVKKAKALWW